MASADIPEEEWATAFSPSIVRERMRWAMEYDLLGELAGRLAAKFPQEGKKQALFNETEVPVASVL